MSMLVSAPLASSRWRADRGAFIEEIA